MSHPILKSFAIVSLFLSISAPFASAAPRYHDITYAGYGDYYTVSIPDTTERGREDAAAGITNYRWGLIDPTGKEQIPCRYSEPLIFNEAGFTTARTSLCDVEIIDINGRQYTTSMSEDLISVEMSDDPAVCYAFIRSDNDTDVIRLPDNKFITHLPGYVCAKGMVSHGRIPVYSIYPDISFRFGLYDLSGREIVPTDYIDIGPFSEGLAPFVVFEHGWDVSQAPELQRMGFLDLDGNIVIPAIFKCGETPVAFSEGLANVFNGVYSLYIDRDGKHVIDNPDFVEAYPFENGRALVRSAGYGFRYIDRTGKLLDEGYIPTEDQKYDFATVRIVDGKEIHDTCDASGRPVRLSRDPDAFDNNYAIAIDPETGYVDLIDSSGNTALRGIAEHDH